MPYWLRSNLFYLCIQAGIFVKRQCIEWWYRMFEKQTLLVLGAGASRPYGFPLGDGLIKEIISSIRNDIVLFPCASENRSAIINNKMLNLSDYSNCITSEKSYEVLNSIRSCITNKRKKTLVRHTEYLHGIQ